MCVFISVCVDICVCTMLLNGLLDHPGGRDVLLKVCVCVSKCVFLYMCMCTMILHGPGGRDVLLNVCVHYFLK